MYENYEIADYPEKVNGVTKIYKGAFHVSDNTKQYILHGRGTRLSELDTEYADLSLYDNLLGNGKVINILYGQIGDTGIQVINGQVILNNKQVAAINDAISQYIDSYLTNAYESLKEEFLTYMEAINETLKRLLLISRKYKNFFLMLLFINAILMIYLMAKVNTIRIVEIFLNVLKKFKVVVLLLVIAIFV